ncbi:YidC/Oxa1 family membrane protein insertase [Effusibacillus dendaii]|uniref:Membrane protein insertase YidC n=1 Tax=Effusibacillus dendaii TaxID=2743772 RepID=A0A7I8DBL0_9BACL|nr:YidC/Oxa1 family membrane protein insertase [Effusibacillus dendaii]BCJ87475.1 membrane protein insertase YidC [Effusibacillus dendaii]
MKKLRNFSLLMLVALVTAGCGARPMGELNRSNIWGKFVGLISDALDYFGHLLGDYGLSILVVTLIVRIIIFPLVYKQLKHSKVMQEMQPEMTKIREKYKDDPQRMNQEMMKLFQSKGTNPLSGCLPILVQMPILIGLYQAIMYNHDIQNARFLGLVPLGQPDHTFILPVLAALTTFIQTRMTMMDINNPQQKMMMYIMPAMIFFFSFSFPAALALYWAFGNILTIIQYYFLKRPQAAAKQGGANK